MHCILTNDFSCKEELVRLFQGRTCNVFCIIHENKFYILIDYRVDIFLQLLLCVGANVRDIRIQILVYFNECVYFCIGGHRPMIQIHKVPDNKQTLERRNNVT